MHTHAHTLLYHTCIAHIKHHICNRVNISRQLHTLPQLHIMKYLDVHSLVAMTMTCHELYILGQDSFLWRELFTRDFGQGKYVPPYSYSSPHSQSVFSFPVHILIPNPYSHSQSICRVTAHIHNLEAGRSVMIKRTQILFESLSET